MYGPEAPITNDISTWVLILKFLEALSNDINNWSNLFDYFAPRSVRTALLFVMAIT